MAINEAGGADVRHRGELPVGITPHKLRHTFASILVATGEDLASVMAQLGHTDPAFTRRATGLAGVPTD